MQPSFILNNHQLNISSVIIDDDAFIQELLKDKLNQYFPEVLISGTAYNGQQGLELIQRSNPELVFLDVEMTDMTGFEMLSKLETINFKTIFITSYKHYAIKAIRFNALDYLLKPFDLEELKNAIKRFKERSLSNNDSRSLNLALQNLKSISDSDKVLTLKTQKGELYLTLKDIIYVEGDRNYSNIHLINGRKELVAKTLSSLEELLEDKGFFRCHKSYLVNKSHIQNNQKSFEIELTNTIILPISRRKQSDFKNWIK